MSAFKKVGKSDHIRLRQRGGAVVFLESNDDFEIIAKRWFFDFGQDVHFESADQYETGTGGGGCQAVIQLVAAMRSSGIAAFGIVDRDVLLGDGHWTLWWSIDDAAFQGARPYGDWIRVLLRWELENYLLDPDAMAYVANNAPRMTSLHSADSVTASCLGCVDELKERSAATITAIAANQKAPGAGYGCNPLTRSPALGSQLVAHLQGLGITNAAQEIQRHRVQIERFDVPSSIPQTRWERLTRMLDGKAALKYLSACTPTRFDAHHGFLAERMRYAGRIPAEIRGYIEEFQAAVV